MMLFNNYLAHKSRLPSLGKSPNNRFHHNIVYLETVVAIETVPINEVRKEYKLPRDSHENVRSARALIIYPKGSR